MSESTRQIDCIEAMRQLYDYLDREMSAENAALIREHLQNCAPCYAHAAFEKDLLAVISSGWENVHAPQQLVMRIQQGLRDAGLQP